MDQMLLTGLVSFRFSSLADSSPSSEDWVTAPKLAFSVRCTGKRSVACVSGEKDSLLESASGNSVARELDTADRIPTQKTVTLKKIRGLVTSFTNVFGR